MQNFNNGLESLFSPVVKTTTTTKGASEFYKPSLEKGKNGSYQSVIRFVSWFENPETPYTTKYTYWLKDPKTGQSKCIDCPTSVGKPSILNETFFRLYNSKNATEKELAKEFQRIPNHYALVQVLEDKNDPSLEGKILIWKFGKKILEKINNEMNPLSSLQNPEEPFSILNGRPFCINITKVSDYPNYDQSNFFAKAGEIPLRWDIEQEGNFVGMNTMVSDAAMDRIITKAYETSEFFKKNIDGMFANYGIPVDFKAITDANLKKQLAIFGYLAVASPNLKQCEYKEWDAETTSYVNDVISSILGYGSMPMNTANVVNHTQSVAQPYQSVAQPMVQPMTQPMAQPMAQPVGFSTQQMAQPVTQQNVTAQQIAQPVAQPVNVGGATSIDDLLNGIVGA